MFLSFFFFNDTAPTEIYTLSLHRRSSDLRDPALDGGQRPVLARARPRHGATGLCARPHRRARAVPGSLPARRLDRKSTRLNSSHMSISYAVFCLKKKTKTSFSLTSSK